MDRPKTTGFARKHPRVSFGTRGVLAVAGGDEHAGWVLDLSVASASINLSTCLPRETIASLTLSEVNGPTGPPSMRCAVRSVEGVRVENGERLYRHGLVFLSVDTGLRTVLEGLMPQTLGLSAEVATTPEGREHLFQAALRHLAGKEYQTARQLAIYAVKGDPTNRSYQALVHQVNAEEAIAAGRIDDARIEIERALTRLPGDETMKRLAKTIAPARPSTFGKIASLFRPRG